jgi:hypothetical protein
MIIPQMNANERKGFSDGFTVCSGMRHLLCDSTVSFAKNNNNNSRSFAFICGK